MINLSLLSSQDHTLSHLIEQEYERQEEHLELIASENYTSQAVIAAQGSVLTNKYAEGYPGKRYYAGCEFVDQVEVLAIERAKQLFGATYANVQPHSGSQANAAVYLALLQPGDVILGMSLSAGGHLTHGSKINFSGQMYSSVTYGLDPATGRVDYDEVARLAEKYRPQLIVAGFSAYSRILDWQKFRDIADRVGAYLMVDMAHVAGLVAAGLYPSPIDIADVVTTTTHKTLRGPRGGMILTGKHHDLAKKLNTAVFPGTQGGPLMHVIAAKAVALQEALSDTFKVYQKCVVDNARAMADVIIKRGYHVVSDGTDNHMFLISFLDRSFTGQQVEHWLEQAHISLNKNTVPGETRSPFKTSGIRVGTPAMTTRGLRIEEACEVANALCDVLDQQGDAQTLIHVRNQILNLCRQFPVYR